MRKINAFCIKRKKLIIRNPPKIKKKDNTLEIQVYKERNKDNYYIKIPIEKDDIIVTKSDNTDRTFNIVIYKILDFLDHDGIQTASIKKVFQLNKCEYEMEFSTNKEKPNNLKKNELWMWTANRFKMFLRSKIKHPNKQRRHNEK